MTAEPQAVAALPHSLRDEGGPVFAEPWQAQAFAMAVKLSEQGHFTWKEWAAALALELQVAADRGEPDDGSRYYEHWLYTIEKNLTEKGVIDPKELEERVRYYQDNPGAALPDRQDAEQTKTLLEILRTGASTKDEDREATADQE